MNGATVTTPSNFSFKLPDSTTVTPITAKDASSIQTPNQSEEQTGTSIFGSGSSFSFADLAKNSAESDNDNVPFKNIGNGFSFAALAQNNSNGTPAFKSPSGGEFIGLTNGDTFNNLMKPKPVANDDGENVAEDPNYDPHYEPIIALPDEIQVSTGEESETKLFGERAKLYRYDSDNKEVSIRHAWRKHSLNLQTFSHTCISIFSGKNAVSANSKFCITLKTVHTDCCCDESKSTSWF